jgi:hypothetical protein
MGIMREAPFGRGGSADGEDARSGVSSSFWGDSSGMVAGRAGQTERATSLTQHQVTVAVPSHGCRTETRPAIAIREE